MTKNQPKVKTKNELDEVRKNEYLGTIHEQKRRWEEANPSTIEQPFIKSEFLVDNPNHKSINERREKEMKDARIKIGLLDTITDVKVTDKDPSLKYVENPKVPTKTLLDNQRKEEIISKLKLLNGNMGNFKDMKGRLEERENCLLRLGYKEVMGKTKGQVEDERKKDIIDNLTSKYGDVTVGIHGQELPKFSGDGKTKEWWKFQETFNEEPEWTSAVELKEN